MRENRGDSKQTSQKSGIPERLPGTADIPCSAAGKPAGGLVAQRGRQESGSGLFKLHARRPARLCWPSNDPKSGQLCVGERS